MIRWITYLVFVNPLINLPKPFTLMHTRTQHLQNIFFCIIYQILFLISLLSYLIKLFQQLLFLVIQNRYFHYKFFIALILSGLFINHKCIRIHHLARKQIAHWINFLHLLLYSLLYSLLEFFFLVQNFNLVRISFLLLADKFFLVESFFLHLLLLE